MSLAGKSSGKFAYLLAAISCSLHMTQPFLVSSFPECSGLTVGGVNFVAVVSRA